MLSINIHVYAHTEAQYTHTHTHTHTLSLSLSPHTSIKSIQLLSIHPLKKPCPQGQTAQQSPPPPLSFKEPCPQGEEICCEEHKETPKLHLQKIVLAIEPIPQ